MGGLNSHYNLSRHDQGMLLSLPLDTAPNTIKPRTSRHRAVSYATSAPSVEYGTPAVYCPTACAVRGAHHASDELCYSCADCGVPHFSWAFHALAPLVEYSTPTVYCAGHITHTLHLRHLWSTAYQHALVRAWCTSHHQCPTQRQS